MGVNVIAGLWGFAEATLFFIVPDVYLSRVALAAPRRALWACGWALAGALLGGALMLGWGALAPETAEAALDAVPGISTEDVEGVRQQLRDEGVLAVFLGPLTGTPYKIYAVEVAVVGMSWLSFLAVSIPARLIRFVLVTLLAAGIVRLPRLRETSLRTRYAMHALAWGAFYVFYFSVKGW